jgi:hypothetical protein
MHPHRIPDDIAACLVVFGLVAMLAFGMIAVDPVCVGCP